MNRTARPAIDGGLRWLRALAALAAFASPLAWAGLEVRDGAIVEGSGAPFVMRGVNVAHVWYPDRTPRSIKDIAATGANTVRLVLANGLQWSRTSERDVRKLIQQAKENRMIAILEVHDATGFGDQPRAAQLASAVTYWLQIKDALIGQEDYVVINIANEPFGNAASADSWVDQHKEAIVRLREAGLKHLLMVDAPNWGQDWTNTMRARAHQVFEADPLRRTAFSVHMYEVYASADAVRDYFAAFKAAKLPLVVGEFSDQHKGKAVAADAIMSLAKRDGVGYLGWSWSGNGEEVRACDLVDNFDAAKPTRWGARLFGSPDGITATSRPAAIFK